MQNLRILIEQPTHCRKQNRCAERTLTPLLKWTSCKQSVFLDFELLHILRYNVPSENSTVFTLATLLNEYELVFMFKALHLTRVARTELTQEIVSLIIAFLVLSNTRNHHLMIESM